MILERLSGHHHLEGHLHGDEDRLRDFHRVWKGCIVYYDALQWEVRQVVGYNGTPVMHLKCYSDIERCDMIASLNHPEVDCLYPELGYFNTPTSAVYLSRAITRQWRRGITPNTIRHKTPFCNLLDNAVNGNTDAFLGIESLYERGFSSLIRQIDLFRPVYPTYEEALAKLIGEEALSVALSRDVLLALHPINGEVHVMYHEMSVGAIDGDTFLIKEEAAWLTDTLREVVSCQR